jgi:hypothetical protein
MKNLKTFFSEIEKNIDEDNIVLESSSFKTDPPNIIVLKRKAIRIFPDGRKVALYHADKIDKYISIPYSNIPNENVMQVHENWIPKGNIGILMRIIETGESDLITFSDNLGMKVDVTTAKSIVDIYNKVSASNKSKIEKMVNKDKINFAKVAAFAHGTKTDLGQ